MPESNFKKLQKKVAKKKNPRTGKPYGMDTAGKIAYSVGVKKYGKAGMAKKAAAGRKKASR